MSIPICLPLLLLILLGIPVLSMAGRPCRHQLQDETPRTCAECHTLITQQWARSGHARAWTNPDFVEDARDSEHRVCLPCHAPTPLLKDKAPAFLRLRAENRDDGVDCHACHFTGSAYAGPYVTRGPHATEQDRDYLPSSAFCGRCHLVEYEQYQSRYLPSRQPSETPKQCVECHMPQCYSRLTQGHILSLAHPRRAIHDHSLVVWDDRVTRDALQVDQLSARRQGEEPWEVTFSLTNRGAGHLMPTGKFGDRELCLRVELLDANGRELGSQEHSLLASNESGLVPGKSTPFRLLVTLSTTAAPSDVRLSVQRVNKDRSFQYRLATCQRPVGD